MAPFGRLFAIITWLTVVSLFPLPWEQLALLNLQLPSLAWASPQLMQPLVDPSSDGSVAAVRPSIPNAFPIDTSALQRPGALGVGTRGEIKPTLDFADSLTRGAGVTIRLEAPAEPVIEVELRLRGVPGRQARQEPGGRHVYDLPADGGAPAQGPRSLLVDDDDLLAQAATRTPTSAQAGTPTRTPTASASLTPTAATTGTPAATSTPTATTTAITVSGTPTATPQPSGPQSGNRYGARIELRYEETQGGVKETLRFLDRPKTNILEYELDARGLTVAPQADGSLRLFDHAGRHAFTIPAPTFEDARGQKGSASYRLTDKKLEVVLDPQLVASGTLPLEVDPTILTAASQIENAAAPWQRQSVVAVDGTQAFFFYDTTSGSTGIKFVTSTDNLASVSSPTTVVSGQGAGGFAVELDQESDTIFVAMTGSGGSNNYYLRVYPLTYNSGTRTWSVGTAVDVQSNTSASYPRWSGTSVVIERGSSQDYVWVGADEQTASTSYTSRAWHATLTSGSLGGTWTGANPPFTTGTTYVHYGALVAITNGVAAVGRDAGQQKGAVYVRGSGWGTLEQLTGKYAWGNGKEFSLLAVADPLSTGTATFVPLAVYPTDDDGTKTAMKLHIRRYNTTTWTNDALPSVANDDASPAAAWDGTSFYVFRLKKNSLTDWQINGHRGKLTAGQTPAVELDPDRTWIVEATGNKDINWLALPRTLGTEIIPFFYIRDKASDELVVQTKRIDFLGERPSWQYQSLVLPGAGTLKVHLASGNLHYAMQDARFGSRVWDDEITRVYDAQSELFDPGPNNDQLTLLGKSWTGMFSPRLHFFKSDGTQLATSDGTETRVVYWTHKGAKYIYLKDVGGGTGNWKPELGLKMTLERPNTDSTKVYKLTDLYGQTTFFNASGKPTRKQDHDAPYDAAWTWTYQGNGDLDKIEGVKKTDGNPGRVQKFTYTSNRVTRVTLANPGVNPDSCSSTNDCLTYDYAYTNGRLTSVTLVSNSTEFSGGNVVRVQYGYDANGLLNSITTPEGNVHVIGYDSLKRVAWIDLPDPTTGAQSTCGQTHCWQFAYAEGVGQVTVMDPRGNSSIFKALGSGSVYEFTYPIGVAQSDMTSATVARTWTGDQNKASEKISQSSATLSETLYEYDTKANRTKATVKNFDGSMPSDLVTNFTFNAASRRTSMTDPNNNTTTYTYTSAGDIDVETDPENYSTNSDYNNYRLLTQFADKRGKITTSTYDLMGQLLTETRPDGSMVTLVRDPWGRVRERRVGGTTPNDNTDHLTIIVYDDLSRIKSTRVRMGPTSSQDHADDLLTTTTYDRDDNVLTIEDPSGQASGYATLMTYDRRGRLTTVVSPPGNSQTGNADKPCQVFEYDQAGNQTKVRTAIVRGAGTGCPGTQWSDLERTYDKRHLKVEEKLINLNTTEYGSGEITTAWQYDGVGQPIRVTDSNSNYVVLGYDAAGRKIRAESAVRLTGYTSSANCHGISGAFCRTERWAYDGASNVLTEYIPRGTGETQTEVSRQYTYFKNHRLKTKINELGKTWTYTYDGNGNKLTEVDPLTHATTWTYDERNRVLTVEDALGNKVSYTYDRFGNRPTLTDQSGNVTTYAYDKNDRLVSVRDPVTQSPNWSSTLTYDKNGNRLSLADARGKVQSATYDALNRMLSETTPSAFACAPTCSETSRTATQSYTLDGQRNVLTDFTGTSVTFGYDSARRLNVVNYSDSTPDVGYVYDKVGNRTRMTEAGSTTADYAYDELNRLLTEPRGSNVLTYQYDRRDNLSVTYPDNKVIASTYDAAARLQSLDDWRGSSTGRTSFTYDDANRKTAQTVPSGAYTSWSYDNANRLSQVEHKTSSTGTVFGRFSYTYDRASNRVTQTDHDGTNTYSQAFEYDGLHRLIRETPRSAISTVPLTYSYDAAGNRTATGTGQALVEDTPGSNVSYSGGNTSTNNTNASGGSYTKISGTGNYVDFSFTGNAVTFVYSTDSDAGTVRLTLDPSGANTTLGDINQCAATSWQNQKTFTGLSNGTHTLRVTFQSTCPGSVDNHVNVDAFRGYNEVKSYTYDDDNRLKEIKVGGATDTSFEYDQNGSMTKKTQGANVTAYSYDGARRLTDVSLNGSSQASFAYDGNGARKSKTAPSGTTTYVNDTRALTQVLQATKAGNTLTYIPGLLQHDPSQSNETAKWAYFHQDAQNNRALSDNGASRSKWWEYDPFGTDRPGTTGTANSDFQYAGEQKDPETGLLNLRARYYDPALGRFISRDLLGGRPGFPQTLNRYAYALNNPLRRVDPTGYASTPAQATAPKQIPYDDYLPPSEDDGFRLPMRPKILSQLEQEAIEELAIGYALETFVQMIGLADNVTAPGDGTGRTAAGDINVWKGGAWHSINNHVAGEDDFENAAMAGQPKSKWNTDFITWHPVPGITIFNGLAILAAAEIEGSALTKDGYYARVFDVRYDEHGIPRDGPHTPVGQVWNPNKWNPRTGEYGDWEDTYVYTVITDEHGNLRTAFPGVIGEHSFDASNPFIDNVPEIGIPNDVDLTKPPDNIL